MIRAFLRPLRDALARRLVVAAHTVASDPGWSSILNELGLPNMMGGLIALRGRGLKPMRIVDGGACQGDWTRMALRVFSDAKMLMVEPQTRHAKALQALADASGGQVLFAPCLVGPAEREAVEFTVTDDSGGGTGSSVLPENSDVPRHVVSLPMTTLDRIIETTEFGAPDLIKLDVQGYELAVLEGATNCLRSAQAVLLEVSLWPYNQGSPLIVEVLSWMDRIGFRAFEVFDISKRPMDGITVQMDILFLRKSHWLLKDVETRFTPRLAG